METSVVVMALAIVVAALVIVVGLAFALRGRKNGTAPSLDNDLALARLQERDSIFTEQLERFKSRIADFEREGAQQAAILATAKERSAALEEKIIGLERELSRERELGGQFREKLEGELSDEHKAKERLQDDWGEQAKKLAAAERLELELREQIKRAINHITERDVLIANLREALDEIRSTVASRDSEVAASRERESSLAKTIGERDEQLKGLQDQLRVEFENIANKVLSTATDQLSEKSKETLTTILDPLRNRIAEFQMKIESSHLEDTRDRSALSEQIRQVAQTSQSLGLQAENLAKALKGDSQLRGNWAEMRLERILEKSGLVRGREFVRQGEDLNIKGEDGASQRPDIVILLPENRHFVIDSKLSLVDYLEYESADTDELRSSSLRKLLVDRI